MEQVSARARPVRPAASGMDVREFLAFLEFRPQEERWQLIDGVAIMMAPPTQVHQRIALNLAIHLNSVLPEIGEDLFAYVETGVRAPGLDSFRLQPDVAVLPGAARYESYVENFRLVAEILSPSNTEKLIGLKLSLYRAAPGNDFILVLDSRRIAVDVYARSNNWGRQTITDPDAIVVLAGLNFSCRAAEIYRGTPLDPSR